MIFFFILHSTTWNKTRAVHELGISFAFVMRQNTTQQRKTHGEGTSCLPMITMMAVNITGLISTLNVNSLLCSSCKFSTLYAFLNLILINPYDKSTVIDHKKNH